MLKLAKTVLVTQSDPRHVTRHVSSALKVLVLVLCRLKRPAPRRKYGLLSDYDDSVEMVEGESDEDDTLYEARSLRRSEVTLPAGPPCLGWLLGSRPAETVTAPYNFVSGTGCRLPW